MRVSTDIVTVIIFANGRRDTDLIRCQQTGRTRWPEEFTPAVLFSLHTPLYDSVPADPLSAGQESQRSDNNPAVRLEIFRVQNAYLRDTPVAEN